MGIPGAAGELYAQQLELECKEILACGHLAEIPCDNPDGLAMVSVVRHLDGTPSAVRVREDVAARLDPVLAGHRPEELLHISDGADLGGYRVRRDFAGRTGVFPRRPQASEYPDVSGLREGWVIRREGRAVAWAVSARENDFAAELGCETVSDYRRQGLARQVCAAWAAAVLDAGKTAFYSHQFDNHASAALAASLGVEFVFEASGFDLVEA